MVGHAITTASIGEYALIPTTRLSRHAVHIVTSCRHVTLYHLTFTIFVGLAIQYVGDTLLH